MRTTVREGAPVSIIDREVLAICRDVSERIILPRFRNLAADDALIVPELSFDLVNWVSGDANLTFVSEIHQGDGTSLVRYRTNFPHDPATQSRVFLRLHVSLP